MKRYFISGIGTDVGKTLAAAVLTESLKADYWKPVQTGSDEGTDTQRISGWITNPNTVFFKESYLFEHFSSPHLAADKEGEEIDLEKIKLPETKNEVLLIEGAGGLLVPLNKKQYVIDLAKQFDAEVILVCRNYLGCINHTLLSMDYLFRHNYKIKGIIMNGYFEPLVKSAILNYAPIPVLAEIEEMEQVSKHNISLQARRINAKLFL